MEKTKEADYFNSTVQRYLDEYIKEEKYGEFTSILHEIMQRRMYEYGFLNQRAEREIKNLAKNLVAIEFVDNIENSDKDTLPLASYSMDDKKIRLNKKAIKSDYNYLKSAYQGEELNDDEIQKAIEYKLGNSLVEDITHEVYHAITLKEKEGLSGLMHYDRDDDDVWIEGTDITEYVTEVASARTASFGRMKNIDNGFVPTTTYEYSAFIPVLEAQVLGVSEKEFLAESLDSYERYEDFIKGKYFYDDPLASRNFSRFENSVRKFSMAWKYNQDKTETASSFKTLFRSAYQGLSDQIAVAREELTPEYIGQINTRYKQINQILISSLSYLNQLGYYDLPTLERVLNELYDTGEVQKTSTQIRDLNEVFLKGYPRDSKEYNAAMEGTLTEYYKETDAKKYDDYLLEDEDTIIDKVRLAIGNDTFFEYKNKLIEDDFYPDTKWDISIYEKAFGIVAKRFKEDKKREQIENPDLDPITKTVNLFTKGENENEARE